MSEYKEKIINLETGEETWRDYTAKEVKAVEAAQQEAIELEAANQAAKAARAAVLDKLGLTAEDIAALGL